MTTEESPIHKMLLALGCDLLAAEYLTATDTRKITIEQITESRIGTRRFLAMYTKASA